MSNTDQMREFLARALPWPQEGEAPFYVGVHWMGKGQDGKLFWSGRAARSVHDAVKAIQWAQTLPETKDIYVAMGAQRVAQTKVSGKGNAYLMPIRNQTNVLGLKSLFLDIDFKGGENGYNTSLEATTALADFMKKTGMPRPTIVLSTGGGLHVHWLMSRTLTLMEWQPLANALAEATKKVGLKCDTQCTIDSARILRVPDTFNCKQEAKRPVRLAGQRLDFDYLPERLKDILLPFANAPMLPALPARAPVKGVNDELSAGIEQRSVPPTPLPLLEKACPFVAEAVTSGGKDYTNPLWNLTTLVATFTVEGVDAAHLMADMHPGYDEAKTDELYQRKDRERTEKNLGWPSCKTISATGAKPCDACVHKAAGKTPFHFVTLPSPPAAPVPPGTPPGSVIKPTNWDLPANFTRDADGIVSRIVIQPDGSTELIAVLPYPMTEPWLQKDPWILNFSTVNHHGHVQHVALPFSEVMVAGGGRGVFARQGIAVRAGKQAQLLEDFIVSWIEKLQKQRDTVVKAMPFGWTVDHGKVAGFTFGGQTWTPAAPLPASVPDPVIGHMYSPAGSEDPWFAAAELITSQGRPHLDAVLASAFAAPLVRFTGREGMMMSIYSQASGIGKTTALKVAQAVWADPVRAMQGLSDTPLSVLNKIGQLHSLPLYWDELKSRGDTDTFVKLMFQLTSGREKSRLHSDTSQRKAGHWYTMLVSASNESLMDHIVNRTKQSVAGIMRAFEYEVPAGKVGQISTADADRIMLSINDNYGHVGLEYAKWMGANIARIDKDIMALRTQVEKDLNSSNEERYWAATVTVILAGARYANELGFLQFDQDQLKRFMYGAFEGMRGMRNAQPNDMTFADNIDEVLGQFLSAMAARHTLWTNIIPVTAGRPNVKVVRDATKLDEVVVQVGVDNKVMRIVGAPFSDWLAKSGYSRHQYLKSLTDRYGARQMVGRIGGGTDRASLIPQHLIEIQFAGTPIAAALEGDVS